MHVHVPSSTLHSSTFPAAQAKGGNSPRSTDRSMDNQIVIYPYNGILLSGTRDGALIDTTTWVNLENIVLGERCQSQKATCCVILSMKCPEQAHP